MDNSPPIMPQTPSTPTPRNRSKVWLLIIAALVGVALASVLGWWVWQHAADAKESTTDAALIQITAHGFSPAAITVHRGSVIEWHNADHAMHQVAGDAADSAINSDADLFRGDRYQLSLDQPGTYVYHDPLHLNTYKGTIVVE